ncbi:hypothetical protein RQP46_005401 [Phenoliferia psychrophenolica]
MHHNRKGGTGPACLAGCDPQFSVAGYCAPLPVCQSNNYTFTDTSRILTNTSVGAYLGNVTQYDFTLDHQDNNATSIIQDGELALILTEAGGGTKVSSTRNILYGSFSASIKTTGAVGVVTAFITMSGTKDEIDWGACLSSPPPGRQWTASNMSEAQNNYFWEGDVGSYNQSGRAIAKNRASAYHVYGVNWTPDLLEWTVDGTVTRTLTRASTLSGGLYKFPQTPSKIQFSVWPAGISSSAAGTISWAGGMIDWSGTGSLGYYAAYVQWLNVQCYDPAQLTFQSSNSTKSSNSTSRFRERDGEFDLDERSPLWKRANAISSYVYGTNSSAGQMSVFASDAQTVMSSVANTGKNMLNPVKNASSASNTAVGNWWAKQGIAVKVGIIIGAVAVVLFLLVACCTCVARRKDKKQYAQIQKAARAGATTGRDQIPLVEKKTSTTASSTPAYSPPENYQTRPSQPASQGSYGFQQPAYGSQANLGRPQWPDERTQQSQQAQPGYGQGAYSPYGQQHQSNYGGQYQQQHPQSQQFGGQQQQGYGQQQASYQGRY